MRVKKRDKPLLEEPWLYLDSVPLQGEHHKGGFKRLVNKNSLKLQKEEV